MQQPPLMSSRHVWSFDSFPSQSSTHSNNLVMGGDTNDAGTVDEVPEGRESAGHAALKVTEPTPSLIVGRDEKATDDDASSTHSSHNLLHTDNNNITATTTPQDESHPLQRSADDKDIMYLWTMCLPAGPAQHQDLLQQLLPIGMALSEETSAWLFREENPANSYHHGGTECWIASFSDAMRLIAVMCTTAAAPETHNNTNILNLLTGVLHVDVTIGLLRFAAVLHWVTTTTRRDNAASFPPAPTAPTLPTLRQFVNLAETSLIFHARSKLMGTEDAFPVLSVAEALRAAQHSCQRPDCQVVSGVVSSTVLNERDGHTNNNAKSGGGNNELNGVVLPFPQHSAAPSAVCTMIPIAFAFTCIQCSGSFGSRLPTSILGAGSSALSIPRPQDQPCPFCVNHPPSPHTHTEFTPVVRFVLHSPTYRASAALAAATTACAMDGSQGFLPTSITHPATSLPPTQQSMPMPRASSNASSTVRCIAVGPAALQLLAMKFDQGAAVTVFSTPLVTTNSNLTTCCFIVHGVSTTPTVVPHVPRSLSDRLTEFMTSSLLSDSSGVRIILRVCQSFAPSLLGIGPQKLLVLLTVLGHACRSSRGTCSPSHLLLAGQHASGKSTLMQALHRITPSGMILDRHSPSPTVCRHVVLNGVTRKVPGALASRSGAPLLCDGLEGFPQPMQKIVHQMIDPLMLEADDHYNVQRQPLVVASASTRTFTLENPTLHTHMQQGGGGGGPAFTTNDANTTSIVKLSIFLESFPLLTILDRSDVKEEHNMAIGSSSVQRMGSSSNAYNGYSRQGSGASQQDMKATLWMQSNATDASGEESQPSVVDLLLKDSSSRCGFGGSLFGHGSCSTMNNHQQDLLPESFLFELLHYFLSNHTQQSKTMSFSQEAADALLLFVEQLYDVIKSISTAHPGFPARLLPLTAATIFRQVRSLCFGFATLSGTNERGGSGVVGTDVLRHVADLYAWHIERTIQLGLSLVTPVAPVAAQHPNSTGALPISHDVLGGDRSGATLNKLTETCGRKKKVGSSSCLSQKAMLLDFARRLLAASQQQHNNDLFAHNTSTSRVEEATARTLYASYTADLARQGVRPHGKTSQYPRFDEALQHLSGGGIVLRDGGSGLRVVPSAL